VGHLKVPARVFDFAGELVYDGPLPLPSDVACLTLDELAEGKLYRIEMYEKEAS